MRVPYTAECTTSGPGYGPWHAIGQARLQAGAKTSVYG